MLLPEKTTGKRIGTGMIVLSRKEHFIRFNRTNSIDDIHSIDRLFYFYHEIRWNDVHIMVCMHVLDYLFCNLTFVHPGCLE
jgi:hypothetical protein